jgi:hypothetical protein
MKLFRDKCAKLEHQYLIQCEGTENNCENDECDRDVGSDDAMHSFLFNVEPLENPENPENPEYPDNDNTECFVTSLGPIPPEQASDITKDLANRSFIHAITGEVTITTTDPDPPTNLPTPEPEPKPETPSNPDKDPFSYVTGGRFNADVFYGIVIDTGASRRSTGGYGQYLAYKKTHPVQLDTAKAGMVNVQFGIGSATSIGSITIPTPVGTVEFHIVKADTPFLLCLHDMDSLRAQFLNLTNKIVTPKGSIPVVRRFGHAFILWDDSLRTYITNSFMQNPCPLSMVELRRLHRRFGHPATDRLHKLLERSGHDDIDKKTLEYITKYCSECQKHGKSPGRFKFTIRADGDPVFNYCIIVDIMYIEGNPLLHIIDEATRFQAARWLRSLSAKHTWDALRECWIDTYLGPPDHIVHDAGTNFTSKEFQQLAKTMSITTRSVPVEAHWSVRLVERAHPVLRRAYCIIADELKTEGVSKHSILQMAVKAVNDTTGPDGLVPTLLVFGAYPRITEFDPPTRSTTQRATAIRKAMAEVS